jgi:hypothetical protein
MLAGLGKGGFIKDPNLRFAQQIEHFSSQGLLDLFHLPRTLPHKLAQRLHVGSPQALRHRLDGFAFAVQQEPLEVDSGPMTPFPASERFQEVFQKLLQATIQSFQALRGHALTASIIAVSRKPNLT